MKNDKKKKALHTILADGWFSWKYIWENSKKYAVLQLISVLVEGLYPPLAVLLSAWLFNSLDRGIDFKHAAMIVICMLVPLFAYNLWGYFFDLSLAPKLQKKLQFKIQSDLLKKTCDVELEKYDNPSYYDEFLFVIQDADTHIESAMDTMRSMISAFFTIIATVGLFAYVSPVVMIVLIVSAVLSLVMNTKRKKLDYQSYLKATPLNKKEQYISRVFRLADFAKELRLSKHGETLFKEYDSNTDAYVTHIKVFGRQKVWLQVVDSLNFYLTYLVVIICTLHRVTVTESVLVGGFAIIVNSNWQFRNAMQKFSEMLSELPKESLHISKIRAFLSEKSAEKKEGLSVPSVSEIEFVDVSFGYTDGDMILKDLNLKINQGEHVAIVGCNGAGKSTLIKLLLNLYQPRGGCILYNGIDVSKYNMQEYRKHFGVTFQDYQIFATSLAENVIADTYKEVDKENVEHALRMATFNEKADMLSKGIFTQLTREFDDDGLVFSGGEEQKIAIARAIAKKSEIIIMDEPSAALDPIAEYELNENIKEYGKDKTVIYISHRLSMTKGADRIFVLDEGEIIEEGTHEELMRLGGKYSEMFQIQAHKYILGMSDDV
ncbi:MAG: ABC transporter ATP-binding protein [Lachnospiraceae bacterium]|nr:ABC transporter ATP-binding protein [Lachnospiraceae bacterium]